jgi:hypothetical protein
MPKEKKAPIALLVGPRARLRVVGLDAVELQPGRAGVPAQILVDMGPGVGTSKFQTRFKRKYVEVVESAGWDRCRQITEQSDLDELAVYDEKVRSARILLDEAVAHRNEFADCLAAQLDKLDVEYIEALIALKKENS